MNATMTYNGIAFDTIHGTPALLSRIRAFIARLLATRQDTPFGLPADMSARVYL